MPNFDETVNWTTSEWCAYAKRLHGEWQGAVSHEQAAIRLVREICAVIAWNTGMDMYGKGIQAFDSREVGSACARNIRGREFNSTHLQRLKEDAENCYKSCPDYSCARSGFCTGAAAHAYANAKNKSGSAQFDFASAFQKMFAKMDAQDIECLNQVIIMARSAAIYENNVKDGKFDVPDKH
jgi:hypothetical protein